MSQLVFNNCTAMYYRLKNEMRAVDIYSKKSLKKKKKELLIVENGIFDPNLGSTIDIDNEIKEYSCSCGNLTGKFNNEEICPICNTIVRETFMIEMDKIGFIDIAPYKVLTPMAYVMVASLIGETQFNRIIDFQNQYDIDGNVKEKLVNNNSPYDNLGLVNFYKKFEEIVLFYGRKKRKLDKAEFCIRNKKRFFTTKIPVLPSGLRPIYISNKKNGINYDPINKSYMSIVNNAEIVKRHHKKPSNAPILSVLFNIQINLKDLFDTIFTQKITGKHKLIRSQILGCKTSYSSRMVIISLIGKNFGLDHVTISYKAFLELYYLEILNCILNGLTKDNKFDKMTAFEVVNYLDDAKYSNVVDEDIYYIMQFMIKTHKDGLWLLLNRNPTMDLGSEQLLKVVDIIKDAEQYVMQVPLTSLSAANGDFDGDILNTFKMLEKRVMLEFKKMFSPRSLCIDRTGDKIFNHQFGIQKDSETALMDFTNTTYSKEVVKNDKMRVKLNS